MEVASETAGLLTVRPRAGAACSFLHRLLARSIGHAFRPASAPFPVLGSSNAYGAALLSNLQHATPDPRPAYGTGVHRATRDPHLRTLPDTVIDLTCDA